MLRRFFCPALRIFKWANLPERHELAHNFVTKSPKNIKFPKILTRKRPKYMKLSKILPEISTSYTNRGGPVPLTINVIFLQLTINAIFLQNLPKFIPRNLVICFFKIDKASKEIFAILPRFLEDWLQSEDLVRGAATRTKIALTTFQFWFHYFSAFPFKAFGIYFAWQTKEWYPSVVCALLAISFLEYRNNHTCLPISGSFSKLSRNLTHSR